MTDRQNIRVRNAGIVLLSPFIPRLLERLNFTAEGHFTSQQNREKGSAVSAVCGNRKAKRNKSRVSLKQDHLRPFS